MYYTDWNIETNSIQIRTEVIVWNEFFTTSKKKRFISFFFPKGHIIFESRASESESET